MRENNTGEGKRMSKKNCTPSTRIDDDLSIVKARSLETPGTFLSICDENLTRDESSHLEFLVVLGQVVPFLDQPRFAGLGVQVHRVVGNSETTSGAGSGQVGSRQVRLDWQAIVWFLSSMLPRAFPTSCTRQGERGGGGERERVSRKMREKDAEEGLTVRFCGSRRTRHPRSPSNGGIGRNVETGSGRRSERGATTD